MKDDLSRRGALAAIGATGIIALAPAPFVKARPGDSTLGAGGSRVQDGFPSLADYGRLGSGDDSAVFAAAMADAAKNNIAGLRIPPGTYFISSTLPIDIDDFQIIAHGATISSAMTATKPLIRVAGDNVSIVGLRTLLTAAVTTTHHYRVTGRSCHIDRCNMEYASAQNTPAFYVRGGDGFRLTNSRKSGSNEFIGLLEASDVLIASNQIYGVTGGDDAIALKAITRSSENIRIVDNYVYRHSAIVSFGSQIGMAKADDPRHSRAVRRVHVEGNVADECARIAFIKPGALRSDYRDGLVENVVFRNNKLRDPKGVTFQRGFEISAGHGGIVRNVTGEGNIITARANGDSSTGRKVGALLIEHSGGGANGSIEDIDIGIAFVDPHNGAPFGSPGTSGHPVQNIVRIDPKKLNLGKVNLRIDGNGCSESGVLILPGADSKVTIEKLKITNYNGKNHRLHGGIRTGSAIIESGDDIVLSGNGRPRVTDAGGSFATKRPTQN